MDTCFPDWNTEFPQICRSENELVELLWQDGEVVLNNQTNNRKQSKQDPCPNPNSLIQDYETISWADCPIDEAFEREFYGNLLSDIPPVEPSSELKNDGELQPPAKRQAVIEPSLCASNQVASSSYGVGGGSKTVSPGVEVKHGRNVIRPAYGSITDKETGGSGSSGFWNRSNETDSHKRKTRDAEESECRSDATKLESVDGYKPSRKPGMTGKSRVAEVHNMSERKRRDRINERMRALQELIPNSNKSDKASMLDEAIEYMKSLQWQLQMMWMGSGMAPMMVPGMQHYMPRFGMGMSPPMLPAIPNLMCLSRLPLVDQAVNMAPRTNQALVNYQNQMQNYMGFLHPAPNASQPMNMFNYGYPSAQQNMVLTPPDNPNIPHAS